MSCENCFKGSVLSGEPVGSMVDDAYFSPAPGKTDPNAPSTKAIVLLTDIFGLPLVNSKLLADALAQKVGVDVWVPDLFNGAPPVKVDDLEPFLPDRAGVQMTFWNKLRLMVRIIPRILGLYTNRPPVVTARVENFIKKLKADKKYERVGAVGYCFGGSVAILLAPRGIIDTVVICHPGGHSLEEIKAINIPCSWALAEDDFNFTPKLRESAEAIFKSREGKDDHVEYEFKVWKGTAHGFAARPNLSIPEVKAGFEGSLEQTAEWFKKTL